MQYITASPKGQLRVAQHHTLWSTSTAVCLEKFEHYRSKPEPDSKHGGGTVMLTDCFASSRCFVITDKAGI